MLALRYVYVLALVVWLGGMLILGAIVAPTTFEVLQASAGEHGRELAGAVFGSMLARFHYVAYGAGALLLLTLTAMSVLGPRPARGGVRAAIIAVMVSGWGEVNLGDSEVLAMFLAVIACGYVAVSSLRSDLEKTSR